MLVIFIRALILYMVVFLVIRLMGKKEMSKVQPFELAIIIVIADLASAPMSSRGLSIFDGIIPIIALLITYIIFTFLIQSNNKVQEVVCGKLSIIIKDGKIVEEEFCKQQYTIGDLMSQLRQANVFKIQDVKAATIETNGDINVITMNQNMDHIPLNVIEDGNLNKNNIELLQMTEEQINTILQEKKLMMENILVGTIDEDSNFIYQEKAKKVS